VIRIQFAVLGMANDISSKHFPFDFRNGFNTAFDLVKAICNGRVVSFEQDFFLKVFQYFILIYSFTERLMIGMSMVI